MKTQPRVTPLSPNVAAALLVRVLIARRNTKQESTLHELADAHVTALRTSLRYAFARGRKAVALGKLRGASSEKAALQAVAAVPQAVRVALARTLPPQLWKAYTAAGRLAAGQLGRGLRTAEIRSAKRDSTPKPPKPGKLIFSFDERNDRAIEWAEEHAAELIDDLAETTLEAIKAAIVRGFKRGNLRNVSSEIEDALFEDEVLGAVGDDARAEMIARTESMRAVHSGQREAWAQAVDEGLLSEDAKRVWIYTEVGACDVCEGLDGEVAELDGEYQGGYEGPPAHPNCRCSEGIQVPSVRRGLGDVEGHPFHGNQWTNGSGSAPEPLVITKQRAHNFFDGNKGVVFEFKHKGQFQGKIGFLTSGPDAIPGAAIVKMADSWEGKGRGFGTRMYYSAFLELAKQGITEVVTDNVSGTTPDAARVWQSLARRGIAEKVGEFSIPNSGVDPTPKYRADLTKLLPLR